MNIKNKSIGNKMYLIIGDYIYILFSTFFFPRKQMYLMYNTYKIIDKNNKFK